MRDVHTSGRQIPNMLWTREGVADLGHGPSHNRYIDHHKRQAEAPQLAERIEAADAEMQDRDGHADDQLDMRLPSQILVTELEKRGLQPELKRVANERSAQQQNDEVDLLSAVHALARGLVPELSQLQVVRRDLAEDGVRLRPGAVQRAALLLLGSEDPAPLLGHLLAEVCEAGHQRDVREARQREELLARQPGRASRGAFHADLAMHTLDASLAVVVPVQHQTTESKDASHAGRGDAQAREAPEAQMSKDPNERVSDRGHLAPRLQPPLRDFGVTRVRDEGEHQVRVDVEVL
mmetsp:Transcript_20853/g.58070  ORF Transcript_20853/g.58070 Transcript_20853/m.58070 type:complete len:293 (+) Transcript_20853:437-1315(+)